MVLLSLFNFLNFFFFSFFLPAQHDNNLQCHGRLLNNLLALLLCKRHKYLDVGGAHKGHRPIGIRHVYPHYEIHDVLLLLS